ncbi:MAG: hypothetical protein IGR76_10205 [Synechococcales cyanobacterium T60_A2020_003]|nr:hypothetical protein [Synechococcales cyanobacterium T60_A2020_003]
MGLFDINLGGLVDDLTDFLDDADIVGFLDDLKFDRLNILDLGNLFNGFGSLVLLSSLDLGDLLFDVALDNEILDLADVFDTLLNLGDIGSVDLGDLGNDLNDLLDGLSDTKVLKKIELVDLFQGLSIDTLTNLFDKLAINDLFDNVGDVVGNLKDGDIADVIDDLDLLDGVGSVLDALNTADLLGDWEIINMNRGSDRGDRLTGSDISEFILGLSGADKILGGIADDIINGGKGNDRIFGKTGNDILAGLTGKNSLVGGDGDDVLIAGGRRDRLVGGSGKNWFVFDGKGKNHLIKDFKLGKDLLALTDNINLDDLGITQHGRNALVTVGKTTLALIKGIEADSLSVNDIVQIASDFI